MFVMPCAIVALLSLYRSFLCFGLLVWTQSRPYGLCHCPYAKAHIKGFGSLYLHVYTCLLLCFMLVLAFLVLGFARLTPLVGLWLIGYIWHLWSLVGCKHSGCIAMMPVASCTTFSFSAPCDDMLTMLICATCWLYMHLYTLSYMPMRESYLLVCHPCFNTMKLWTFDPNLH